MQFRGLVGKQEVLILVDSGSEYSFVSADMVANLQCSTDTISAEHFTVADGGHVSCTELVPNMQWWTQGYSFNQDMRVIQLGSFDIILGADWLECHSPMWIHGQHKKMRFLFMGKRILLRGLSAQPVSCKAIGTHKLKGLLRRHAVTHMIQFRQVLPDKPLNMVTSTSSPADNCPPEVQAVLQKFAVVFSEPEGLPPTKTWDHNFPLISGAQPVNTRAYRFPPAQKTEIEN